MIRATGLSATVGAFSLRDVTLEVPSGRWCALVGPTGAGKTTLLECLAGLTPVHGGQIALGDRDVTTLAPEERHVGFVYQRGFLFPHLSVGQNVAYGAVEDARPLARRLGIEPLWDRNVAELSGGERQLVALARALARRAPVLLLDEPFSSLDYSLRVQARATVREIAGEWSATTIIVTHDLAEAAALAHHAVHLVDGRVAESGAAADLIRALQP